MKLSNWIIILISVAAFYLAISVVGSKMTFAEQNMNNITGNALTNALYDAAMTKESWNFNDASARKDFIDALKINLLANLHRPISTDYEAELISLLPVSIIGDDTGFWCYYTAKIPSKDGSADSIYKMIESPKTMYAATYDSYTIEYSFKGDIKLYSSINEKEYYGDYKTVYEEAGKPASLSFLKNDKDYQAELTLIATSKIAKAIESLAYTIFSDRKSQNQYAFSLTPITGPCAAALYQGMSTSTANGVNINVYSTSGLVFEPSKQYYITNSGQDLIYHSKQDCDTTDPLMTGTMQSCAAAGAYPCSKCVLQ